MRKTAVLFALAAVMSAQANAASRKVLVLSVTEEGRQQDGLRAEIGQLVQRAGGHTLDDSQVKAKRACEDLPCLRELANDQKADLILSARISRRDRFERLVDLWIYDYTAGRDLTRSDLCDARDLKDCVVSAAGHVLGPLLSGPAKAAAPPPALRKAQTAPPAARDGTNPVGGRARTPMGVPTWRIGLGVTFGLMAAGALTTAVWAHAQNGVVAPKMFDSTSGEGKYQTAPLFAAGYVLTGVFALGSGFSLLWPTPASKESIR